MTSGKSPSGSAPGVLSFVDNAVDMTTDTIKLKATFDKESDDVGRLMSAIDKQIQQENTWWIGPAADAFRGDWNGTFRPNLQKLQQALKLDPTRETAREKSSTVAVPRRTRQALSA